MDQLRAAIKAIYYHYLIKDAYEMTVMGNSKGDFLKPFESMISREVSRLNPRQLSAYKEELQSELKGKGFRIDDKVRLFVGLPLLFAEKVLTTDKVDYPCVEFEHLFRWREVVKCMGEDLLTTIFLANRDKKKRKDFLWPNVIGHNDRTVNAALNAGLSDIHSHFGGSIDSFQFNWINLMNNVDELYDEFKSMTFSYNPFENKCMYEEMATWCRLAAAIRACLFIAFVKGEDIKPSAEKNAMQALGTDNDTGVLTQLKKRINGLRNDAKKTCYGLTLDYAITDDLLNGKNACSPFGIYAGERQIEYAFFRMYLHPQSKLNGSWIDLFYLYELIKIHFRKEFVFADDQFGLDSYNAVISRSSLFKQGIWPICNLTSVQTSIRKGKDDYVESRVTSGTMGLTAGEYWKGLYTKDEFLKEDELKKRLTFIVQFTKSCNAKNVHKDGRYRTKRAEVQYEYKEMTQFVSSKQSPYEIIGIDVGGSELNFRPEVFAHLLRSGKEQGFKITYHVGEEFYDIADGLRSIWEIIQYANISKEDRLGHCIALAIAADEYYQEKHYTLYIPKQVLLDNLVWLYGFAKETGITLEQELEQKMQDLVTKLYEQIGYGEVVELNMDDYYESLLLRSDDANKGNGVDAWSKTAKLESDKAKKARGNRRAQKLKEAYTEVEEIIARGEKYTSPKMGMVYAKFISEIQDKMIGLVNSIGLCIESCPSSNLQICKLDRYDCHPAIRYYLKPEDSSKKLNIAVCTDDKGTFSTSLANEFSLLALAATKEEGWNKGLEKDFKCLIEQGRKFRFIIKTPTK